MNQSGQDNPDVRQRLLSEALRLFRERGYAATSVREIVEGAGVTKPVLYYYFGSKEGLYLEIMNGIGRLFDLQLTRMADAGGSVPQRLLHFFSGMFQAARDNLETVRLAYAIYYGPPQGAPFVDFHRFFDETMAVVDRLVAEGMSSGEFRPVDRQALVWTLIGSYHTILEEQVCRPEPRIDHDGMIRVLGLVLDGVAANHQGVTA